jgi:membrane associated rhomboid family serine protease
MFPLRDDQPCFSTPFVTYFLIALNLLIFLFEWQLGLQSRGALNSLIAQFGVIPRHDVRILTTNPIAAILPAFTSMFLLGPRAQQCLVSLDLRRQH